MTGSTESEASATSRQMPPITPGTTAPGVPELEQDAVDADQQEDERDVGVGDDGHDLRLPVRLELDDGRPCVSSRVSPAAVATVRPSICASKSSTSLAMMSITFSFSAAVAVSVAASRTAFSAQSALRPLSSASERI